MLLYSRSGCRFGVSAGVALMSLTSIGASNKRVSSASTKRCVALALPRPFFRVISHLLPPTRSFAFGEERRQFIKTPSQEQQATGRRAATGKPPRLPLEF